MLNYIPIKFAVKSEREKVYTECLVCRTEPKLGNVKWVAYAEENAGVLDRDILFNLSGNEPNKFLSSFDFDVNQWHTIKTLGFPKELKNVFLIYYESSIESIKLEKKCDVVKWDIVYPIQRASWRRFVTPKSYLSIYDFIF